MLTEECSSAALMDDPGWAAFLHGAMGTLQGNHLVWQEDHGFWDYIYVCRASSLVTASGSSLAFLSSRPHLYKGEQIPSPPLLEDCMEAGVQSSEQSAWHIVGAQERRTKIQV